MMTLVNTSVLLSGFYIPKETFHDRSYVVLKLQNYGHMCYIHKFQKLKIVFED
jgi:hypothetical protein